MYRWQAIVRVLFLAILMVTASARAEDGVQPEAVMQLAEHFQRDLLRLRALDEQIDSAPAQDREALTYRRDDRSFKLLLQLDQLARDTASLPAGDAVREELHGKIEAGLQSAGAGVLQRIAEIGTRISSLQEERNTASGVQLVAIEAYIQSLETQRFNFYEALVNVIRSKEALGLSGDSLTDSLLPLLYLQGETLVGRLEFTGGALKEVHSRLAEDSANADLAAAATEMGRQQALDLAQLESMIGLLEHLGEEPSDYQAVLLQQGQGLTIKALETSVIVELVQEGWAVLRKAVVERGPDLVFQLLLFLLIVLIFRSLSKLTRKAVQAACERPGIDMSTLLKDVLISVCGGTVMLVGVLMALSQVGISLGPMLAGLGVAGFVVGFALQDTLGNFAAGGMILIYRPYDVDDFIEVAGASGLVKKMSLVSTTITTFDNQTLVVPNSKIWGDVIKNVTAQKLRRVDLVFGIGYGDDIEQAEQVLHAVLEDHDKVLSKPLAMVKLQELADSSVNFVVRPWVKTEDYWNVYWDITREVKLRFDREGISIPFPQRDMHVIQEKEQEPG